MVGDILPSEMHKHINSIWKKGGSAIAVKIM